MKRTISIFLAIALFIGLTNPASAVESNPTSKEEVIYGMLALDGSVDKLYAVNIFKTGIITDYGDWTDVENLTNSDPIIQSGDRITVDSADVPFYYQGSLKTRELPWDITITYRLDGKEINPAQLAGTSGALSINILILQNFNVNKIFFDNYALQIALTLDTKRCINIISSGATVANAGIDKQLSYILLPGEGADITVSADVHDFQMSAMTFSGIKLNLNIKMDDLDFSSQLGEIATAITSLDDGAGSLLDGVDKIKEGMTQYLEGLSVYKNGLRDLSGGASLLASGLSGLHTGLKELNSQNDALVSGALSIQQATFDMANKQIAGIGLPELTPDNYTQILSGNALLAIAKTQLDDIVQFTQGVIAYTTGVSQIETGASGLSDGASTLSSSLSQVDSGAQDLYDGAEKLSAAVDSLGTGLEEYKNGTTELRDGTADIDSKISDKINELFSQISGSDDVRSFVSEKNTEITSVQFLLKTEPIEILKEKNAPIAETKQPSFWDRLLALFEKS